jgi:hypothetical protein
MSVSIARGLLRIVCIKSCLLADIHLNKFLVNLVYNFLHELIIISLISRDIGDYQT